MFKRNRYFFKQSDEADCGVACIHMLLNRHGYHISMERIRQLTHKSNEGTSVLDMTHALKQIGLVNAIAVRTTIDGLLQNNKEGILLLNNKHYIVFWKGKGRKVSISDPAFANRIVNVDYLSKNWINSEQETGIFIVCDFEDSDSEKIRSFSSSKPGTNVIKLVLSYKKYLFRILFGMFLTILITLSFPLITQITVDYGIRLKSYNLLALFLISQTVLFIGETVLTAIRGWLFTYTSTKISLDILSGFISNLFRLKLKFFEIRSVGDLTQRVNDHNRIEAFITNELLYTIFSVFQIFVYLIVLFLYSIPIFLCFLSFSIVSFTWINYFFKSRNFVDNEYFKANSKSQSEILQLIMGMRDIKLSGSEYYKLDKWKNVQLETFDVKKKSLFINQKQIIGGTFFNHVKNVLISFIAATSVINGHISLGEMLSIQFIVGQTNGPLDNLLTFFNSFQDARNSYNRLQEIQEIEKENTENLGVYSSEHAEGNIQFRNVSFRYGGANSKEVLSDVSFEIEARKVTAFVGISGSGKSTILKLLLKIYDPNSGDILVNHVSLDQIQDKVWHQKCGVVMQDNFFFTDSIKNNISFGQENHVMLQKAIQIANLGDIISEFPAGLETTIGEDGRGMSGGQKQRISIARAIFKNPDFLFFDEATSSLDSKNEKIVMNNLFDFFNEKTVLIIAHRLSTIKNADKIIVVDDGKIVEEGIHDDLLLKKGFYYDLIKNQLN